MVTGEYEWFPRPPNTRERVIAALLATALLIAGASSYAGWRLFGDYDKAVVAVFTIVAVIVFTRLMPTARKR
jgi:hypothetical protein